MPAGITTVPCAVCSDPIDARRAACAISHGCCVNCNAPNLKTSREARERAPDFETARLERGERLD